LKKGTCFLGQQTMSYLFLIMAFIFNSSANVLLKLKAGQGFQWKGLGLFELFTANLVFLTSLLLFALNFVFYFLALKNIPLSMAYPLMVSMSFLIVNSVAHFLYHEQITTLQFIGYLLVIAGIAVVSFFSPKSV
jgi:small multidrug resistance pump